jgi:Ser/Thr protein kinase RdoA (MazF antagonist)
MSEIRLEGGRGTPGVVRVGDTVRRPLKPNSAFARELLRHLEQVGFDAAPRYLGSDEQGREVFTFIEGSVPPNLSPDFSDSTLQAAARMIRCYHVATSASAFVEPGEVVCHNDLSPCNTVFREGTPVGIIDFDSAAPGGPLSDLGYAIFLWTCLGPYDRIAIAEQSRRIRVFCEGYGVAADALVIDAVIQAVSDTIPRLRQPPTIRWWTDQLVWLKRHEAELVRGLAT